MKPKRKSAQRTAPKFFFEKELAGEQAPSFETMQRLIRQTQELIAISPWDIFDERDIVGVQTDPSPGGDLCYCSIMGALGQVLSLHAYIGAQSYRLFKKLQKGHGFSIGEFYSSQRAVFVQFVDLDELTPADRQLLKAFGHPLTDDMLAPLFRGIRPGYHPWYLTEEEARVLTECIRAVRVLHKAMEDGPDPPFFREPGFLPVMIHQGDHADGFVEYQIQRTKEPRVAAAIPVLPELDEVRVNAILKRKLPSRGIIQMDHFYGAGMIGKVHERKALFRIALAVEGETATVYPPEAGLPEHLTGDMLAVAALKAIETRAALPSEIHVKEKEFKIVLDPLGKALGFAVKLVRSLPALEYAKESLLDVMGDPGKIQV